MRLFIAALLLVLGVAAPARAWTRHDLLTQEAIRRVAWLSSYRGIPVTAPATSDPSLSTASFQVNYLDHGVGERTSAAEILVRYADEPDWGMDDHLDLSPLQHLVGGSRAYRQRDLEFLHGLVHLGDARGRAEHFYRAAVNAFRRGDRYWGFRSLARCLHYVEDLADPYAVQPGLGVGTLWRTHGDPYRAVTLATNLMNAYETYVATTLEREVRIGRGPFLKALRGEPPADLVDLDSATAALAGYSADHAAEVRSANDRCWTKRVASSRHRVRLTAALLSPADPEARDALDEATVPALEATSRVVQGLLDLAYREALAPRPAPRPTPEED